MRFLSAGACLAIWKIGFMNVPDVPAALARCAREGIELEPMRTSYFISRETVVPTRGDGMAHWRERLFAAMTRNAGSVVEFFRLPDIQIGYLFGTGWITEGMLLSVPVFIAGAALAGWALVKHRA